MLAQHFSERSRSGDSRRAKLLAAGGLNATEMNVGRSEAEWNPVSIVGSACERLVHSMCFALCLAMECPAMKQMISYERGEMKRNGGRNERGGVKDTVAAVRNEEELQAA